MFVNKLLPLQDKLCILQCNNIAIAMQLCKVKEEHEKVLKYLLYKIFEQ